MKILRWSDVLLFNFTLLSRLSRFLNKTPLKSCDLYLINAIDLHYRHRIKNIFYKKIDESVLFFFPKEHVRTLNSKKLKKITHFLLLKAHLH